MFDILFLAIVILLLIKTLFKVLPQLDPWMLPIMIIGFMFHVVFGLPRWPYLFAYLAALLLVVEPFIHLTLKKTYTFKRVKLKNGLSITFLLLTLFLLYAFPIMDFPEASGSYHVGTRSDLIIDESRIEIYGDRKDDARMIRIQLWYPISSNEGYQVAPWIEGGTPISSSLANDWNLPGFLTSHMALYESNSVLEAPFHEDLENLPVVIISHGWSGFKNLHSDLAEELASQGYLAISIDHTYGSVATLLDGGEIALIDGNALPNREDTEDFLDYANDLVTTYGNDVITTINYLETLNASDSLFENTMDLASIGVIGHSTGGGGSVSASLNDERIKALIGLDAWVESLETERLSNGLTIPSLFYRSEGWEISFNNEALFTLINNSEFSELFQIEGSTHYDFSMAYMISTLTPVIGLTGEINGPDFNTLLEETMLAFFDTQLKGLEEETPWEEDARIFKVNP